MIAVHWQPVRPARFQCGKFHICPAAVLGILFAINRRNVWRISIEIWSPDSKLPAVRVDPLPQLFA
jgi:hypothetical protein